MSRWGEEEKKSKGIVGCLVAFAILFVAIYTFVINYQNLEGRRALEKHMQETVRRGYSKSAEEMRGEILDFCEEKGLDVQSEDLELTKGMDKYNNPVVDVHIDFNFTVDVLVTKFEVNLPVAEEVTIVVF